MQNSKNVNTKQRKKHDRMTYIQERKRKKKGSSIETVPEEAHTMNLLNKNQGL